MFSSVRPALVLLVLFTLLTGVAYPLVVTGIARIAFPRQAAGSLIVEHSRAVGSSLIGQEFSDPAHFWGRRSATAPAPYNAAASSGSNLGPTNPALFAAVRARVAALRAGAADSTVLVPVDLVTASGSGLDPQISPAGAEFQVERIARARQLPGSRACARAAPHLRSAIRPAGRATRERAGAEPGARPGRAAGPVMDPSGRDALAAGREFMY